MLYIPRCTHDILKITAAYRSHEAFVVYTHNHNKKICDIRSTRYIYSYMYICYGSYAHFLIFLPGKIKKNISSIKKKI